MAVHLKHVGIIENVQHRCVIAFMQIPGAEDHALVIDTDTLPERAHDAIMHLVQSDEGQTARVFGEVLGRRFMPDSNRPVLDELHDQQRLQKVHVSNISLVPAPGHKIPLVKILKELGKDVSHLQQEPDTFFKKQQKAETSEEKLAIARSLIFQAEMLEKDAKEFRRRAYDLVPSMLPVATITTQPVSVEDVVVNDSDSIED